MSFRAVQATLLVAVIALVVGVRLGGQGTGSHAGALPPASIPTFSTENLGRMAHFYVGGKYVGEPGKEQMSGAMYVEVWVPKQVRRPHPIVMFHGNGQSGAVGAKADFFRLEDLGMRGNHHQMFLDRNSDEIIKFIDGWLQKNIR